MQEEGQGCRSWGGGLALGLLLQHLGHVGVYWCLLGQLSAL